MTNSKKARCCRTAARVVAWAAFGVAGTAAHAQEFSILAGPLKSGGQNTYSWEATYREGLGRYAAWSFSWLNEGHIPDHHRDGQSLQIWGRLPLWDDRLELSAGAGPYRWFDTKQAQLGSDYSNTHGWGGMFTLRAAYYFDNRWVAEMKLNRVQASGGPDTTATTAKSARTTAPAIRGPAQTAHISPRLTEVVDSLGF